MAEKLLRIDRHRAKISLNPNFLGHYNSSWTGTNIHTWFYGLNKFWRKVPAFPKSRNGRAKNKNKNKNKKLNVLGVPMHFRTNRFTFKKSPPPPPLLHPTSPRSFWWDLNKNHVGGCPIIFVRAEMGGYLWSYQSHLWLIIFVIAEMGKLKNMVQKLQHSRLVCVCACAYMYIYIHTYVRIICIYMCICTHIHMYLYIYIYSLAVSKSAMFQLSYHILALWCMLVDESTSFNFCMAYTESASTPLHYLHLLLLFCTPYSKSYNIC